MKSSICAKFKVFIMSGRTPSELIFSAKGGVCFGFLLARDYLGGAELHSKKTLVSLSYKTNPMPIRLALLQQSEVKVTTIYTTFMLEPCLNIPE